MAQNIAMQMQARTVDPNMVKAYLESPESPLNPTESFESNYRKVCEELKVSCNSEFKVDSDFSNSVEHFVKNEDPEIKYLLE